MGNATSQAANGTKLTGANPHASKYSSRYLVSCGFASGAAQSWAAAGTACCLSEAKRLNKVFGPFEIPTSLFPYGFDSFDFVALTKHGANLYPFIAWIGLTAVWARPRLVAHPLTTTPTHT